MHIGSSTLTATPFAEVGEVTVRVTVPGGENYSNKTGDIKVTVKPVPVQTITAETISLACGSTAQINATVAGNRDDLSCGELSYAVADGYGEYISVDGNKVTANKLPPFDEPAYVIVTAAAANGYEAASLEVPITIEPMGYQPVLTVNYGPDDYAKDSKGNLYRDDAGNAIRCFHYGSVPTNPVTVETKEYDGTSDATVHATVAEGLVEGDNIEITGLVGTFSNDEGSVSDCNAGTNKRVRIDTRSGAIEGIGANNYEVTIPDYTTGTIEKSWAAVMADDVVITAGDTVYYCVVAKNYETVSGSKQVIIGKAGSSIKSAPTPVTNLVYNGKSQTLVNAGNVEGGTMEYSLDSENWSNDVPSGTEAGPYVVFYRVAGDVNHESTGASTVLSNIDQPGYEYIGGGGLWVKGSTSGLALTFGAMA